MKKKLGRTKSHREALVRNQMRSLFTSGSLITTTPKAKVLKQKTQSFLDMIKEQNLEVTRKMHVILGNAVLVKKATEYSKKGENKVQIVKIGFRDGDNAQTSKVTLANYVEKQKTKLQSKTTKVNEKAKAKEKTNGKGGETEFVEEKKDGKVLEKGKINLKDRFIKRERARTRSGI